MERAYNKIGQFMFATAFLVASAGVAVAQDQTVTLTMWNGFAASENDPLVALIDKYWTPTHPNIKVDIKGEKTTQALLTALSGGDAPDVVISPTSEAPLLWFEMGAIEDLTDRVAPIEDQVKQELVPASYGWLTTNGKWFGLPFVDFNYAVYYNKDLFAAAGLDPDNPPTTWDGVADAARKLTIVDNGEIKQLGWSRSSDAWGTINMALGFGTKFVGANGEPTADTPEFANALKWETGLLTESGLDKVAAFSAGFTKGDNPFKLGKVGMYIDGSWQSAMLSGSDLNFGVFPIPGTTPDLDGANAVGTNPIVIPVGAKHKDAAWEFVKFLSTNPDVSAEFAATIANLPQVRSRLSDFSTEPRVTFFATLSQSPNAVAWARVPYAAYYGAQIEQYVNQIYVHGTPIDDSLTQLQNVVSKEANRFGL